MWQRICICLTVLALVLAGCATNNTPATTSMQMMQASTVATMQNVSDGFDPSRDGFSFKNYGKADDISNLTEQDMQRLFGDVVCMATVKQACVLIPAARIWMEEINRAMQTGHCEGMAVLSQYFYYNVIKPSQFGAIRVADLTLANNPLLQREIAYWWATQATYPTRGQRVVAEPAEIVRMLRQGFAQNPDVSQLYTLGIYLADFSGGHTVTPIAVRDIDATHVAIAIYDNNLPNETREIVVDVAADTWSYTAPSLNGTTVTYHGDATSKNLELTAVAARLAKQVCHFCPNSPVAEVIDGATTFFFSSASQAAQVVSKQFSAYFVDDLGRRVGIVLGKVYNEIPNAQIGFLRGAPVMWSPLGMPMLTIPAQVNGTLRITGLAKTPINITAFGQGSVVALQNMQLDETLASEIRIDQAQGTVAVAAANDATPDIIVGYSDATQNIEMTVSDVELQRGSKAAVSTDRVQRKVSMLTSDQQSVQITVAANSASDDDDGQERAQETLVADDESLAPLLDSVDPSEEREIEDQNQDDALVSPTLMPTTTARPANNRPQATRTRQVTPAKATPNNNVVNNGNGSGKDDDDNDDTGITATVAISGTVTLTTSPEPNNNGNNGNNGNGGDNNGNNGNGGDNNGNNGNGGDDNGNNGNGGDDNGNNGNGGDNNGNNGNGGDDNGNNGNGGDDNGNDDDADENNGGGNNGGGNNGGGNNGGGNNGGGNNGGGNNGGGNNGGGNNGGGNNGGGNNGGGNNGGGNNGGGNNGGGNNGGGNNGGNGTRPTRTDADGDDQSVKAPTMESTPEPTRVLEFDISPTPTHTKTG